MKQAKSIKNLTALALKRPVTCFMLMLSMIVAGLMSSKLIPLDSWPAVNAPAVFVRASYPGSTPEEIERLHKWGENEDHPCKHDSLDADLAVYRLINRSH